MTMTVGDAVARHGYCEVMVKIAALAVAVKRVPFGEWDYRFTSDPRWRVCVNGGTSATWTPKDAPAIDRFSAYVEHHGWPAALVDASGGAVIMSEETILAALDVEIEAHHG